MAEQGKTPVPGSEREPLPGALPLGPIDSSERVEATIVVRDGASEPDLQPIRDFATAHGLEVLGVNRLARSVRVAGPASAMQSAFGVELQHYDHPGGRYRGRTGPVYVPAAIADVVEAVLGLDDRRVTRARFRIGERPGEPELAALGSGFTAPQVAALYDFPAGSDGGGQCIALIELGGGYDDADVTRYFDQLGLPAPTVVAVSVDGATNAPEGDPQSADGEVALDIQVAGGVAPGARIAVYFAPNSDDGFYDAIAAALSDDTNDPSVISISWGGPEDRWTSQSLSTYTTLLGTAAQLGVTVFAACGDNGSDDGEGDGQAHVDFPASCPNVTGCGGTRLQGSGTHISSEVVWNDTASGGGAGGGGVSAVFPLPTWQSSAGVPVSANDGSTGRGVPDIAANAAPSTGYQIIVDGEAVVFGGTSAVAPLLAGLVARINQLRGAPTGFLNAPLYGGAGTTCRDITSGSNGDYSAKAGWDACTGFGSPNGTALAGALGGSA